MSVEDKNTVDAISLTADGRVRLTISDHLEWDLDEHIIILRDKLNTYLGVIERGEIYEVYPESEGKEFIIQVTMKYPPSETALEFLNGVDKVLSEAGYEFRYKYLKSNQ